MTTNKKSKKTKKVKTARLIVEYLGFSNSIDAQVKELVGLPLAGSGFAFLDGIRDLNFEGPEEKIFEAAALVHSALLSNDFLPEGKVATIINDLPRYSYLAHIKGKSCI